MLKSSSCVYSDAYIFVNGTITIQDDDARRADKRNKT